MEKPGRKLLHISIQMPRDLLAAVDDVATDEGVSRSDAIRKLLKIGLEGHKKRERVVQALEAV